MLAHAAAKSRPRVMVEAHGEEGFRASLRAEVRGRRFAAIFVVGGESIRRWLPWARQSAPAARVVAVLTEGRSLACLRRPGAAARRRLLEETRRALAQGDETWCADGKTLRAARALLRGSPAAAPVLLPPETARLHRAAPARVRARVEALVLGGAGQDRVEAALRRVAPGRSRTRRVETRGEGAVAALNAALLSARAPLIWLCRDAFQAPDESLLSALTEGLAARPYAGGALPLAGPLKDARRVAHFRAAWALSRKGDWHEADRLAHCCCLLLRRDALRAAGALDERLLGVDAALIDLSLRMALAGRPLFEARDALVRCPALPAGIDPADRETLAGKWGAGALRLLESLATALEPRDYRVDPAVQAGFQGAR